MMLLSIFVAIPIINVQAEDSVPTMVSAFGDFMSDGHHCSFEIRTKAIGEPYVSYDVDTDSRRNYGDPPPGSMWRCIQGLGTFAVQEWDDELPLIVLLRVQTGLFRGDLSPDLDLMVLYGRAIIFVGSNFFGIRDFDLVLWRDIFPEPTPHFVGIALWMSPDDPESVLFGPLELGEIVYSYDSL
jgi:hypothetical protein